MNKSGLLFMYAIFQVGGKQYRIVEKQIISVERLTCSIGEQIIFKQVLLIKNSNFLRIGSPFIVGGTVIAEVVTHNLGKKINIVKFRRRKHYKKNQGHRQHCTQIKIIHINDGVA